MKSGSAGLDCSAYCTATSRQKARLSFTIVNGELVLEVAEFTINLAMIA